MKRRVSATRPAYDDPPVKALLGALNYRLQRSRTVEDCLVTCAGKTDGAGAQIHAVMSTMLFAHRLGLTYAHTPFLRISHQPAGDDRWAGRWESFVGLGFGEVQRAEVEARGATVAHLGHPAAIWKRQGTLFEIPHCHAFADRQVDGYRELADRFAEKYGHSPRRVTLPFEKGTIGVAVHLRRGDIVPGSSQAFRLTADEQVLERIRSVGRAVQRAGLTASFHLYSEGDARHFEAFRGEGVLLHLDESPFEAFHAMVGADVLLMAKSSFSYAAALISRGLKVYEPFWHRPLSDWLVVERNGAVDEGRLRDRLTARLAAD